MSTLVLSFQHDIFVAQGTKPGHHLHMQENLFKVMDLHLLGILKKPLILCEGPHDPLFVMALAKHWNISTEGVQMQETSGGCSLSHFQQLVTQVADNIRPSCVRFLHDPNFVVGQTVGLDKKTVYSFGDYHRLKATSSSTTVRSTRKSHHWLSCVNPRTRTPLPPPSLMASVHRMVTPTSIRCSCSGQQLSRLPP